MQLTFQDNDSEAEDDEDPSDFTKTGYKLRDQLLPPTLSPEQSQSMPSMEKAKTLQRMFDEQIQKLSKNKSLTAILDRTVTDVIPCANEHRSHYRRILEILITDMNLNCRVREKSRGSCVAFKIVAVKSEQIDDEDEDLVLLGVTPGIPAASVPFDIQVKQEKTAEDDADSRSQLPSPVFRNKAPPTQKSPAKEMDSEDEGSINVVDSSQGSKRMAATPEKMKPGHIKKKKKSPGAVVMQCELRPRTTRK